MTLREKIIEISNKIRITKDGNNTFANYKYFKPDDLNNLINPFLLEYKIFMKFDLIMKNDYYSAYLKFYEYDNSDCIEYQFDIDKAIVKGANQSQNSGATLTYAKRYSIMNAFNISENKDDFDSSEYVIKTKKIETNQIEKNKIILEKQQTKNDLYKQTISLIKDKNINENIVKDLVKKYTLGKLIDCNYDSLNEIYQYFLNYENIEIME